MSDIMTEEQMTWLARRFREACELPHKSPHTLRTIGGIIIRTATHGEEHCGDVYCGKLNGAIRFFGVEGDGGIYLEQWGHEAALLGNAANHLRNNGWTVTVGMAKDGVATVVTAWHREE